MKAFYIILNIFLTFSGFSQTGIQLVSGSGLQYLNHYLADDGNAFVFLDDEKGYMRKLVAFDSDGELSRKIIGENYFPQIFDEQKKFWLCAERTSDGFVIKQLDFKGNLHKTSVKVAKSIGYTAKFTVQENGNYHMILKSNEKNKIPYIIVDYDPDEMDYQVQDFSATSVSGKATYLGDLDERSYFAVNKTEKDKIIVKLIACDKSNQLKELESMELQSDENHEYINTEIVSPMDSISGKIYFSINSIVIDPPKKDAHYRKFHYKVFQIDAKDNVSEIEFNISDLKTGTSLHPSLYYRTDAFGQLEIITGTFNGKNLVYTTDFKSDLVEPEQIYASAILTATLLKDEYPEFYELAETDCKTGIFKICDDGIARLLKVSSDGTSMNLYTEE